jgi:hypothetical protein
VKAETEDFRLLAFHRSIKGPWEWVLLFYSLGHKEGFDYPEEILMKQQEGKKTGHGFFFLWVFVV